MPASREPWSCRCRASWLMSFAVATGLLMGFGGAATAVADPGSRGSTEHGHSGAGGSSEGSSKTGNPAGTLRTTVHPGPRTWGGDRDPGPKASTGPTSPSWHRGMDNTQEKRGLVAAVPNVVGAVPNADPPIPNRGTPVTNVVASVPNLLGPFTTTVASVPRLAAPVTNAVAVSRPVTSGSNVIAALQNTLTSSDPDFISHTTSFFGLITNTSAADPDDNEFVATVFSGPFFTDVLTSGADPEGKLGFGQTGVGVPGQTVNTLTTPFFNIVLAIPVTDPFAAIFTAFIPFGF
jgi:hypothetical protein